MRMGGVALENAVASNATLLAQRVALADVVVAHGSVLDEYALRALAVGLKPGAVLITDTELPRSPPLAREQSPREDYRLFVECGLYLEAFYGPSSLSPPGTPVYVYRCDRVEKASRPWAGV
ncbi:hypothetical protein EV121DRAFT_288277 [Schizophyllum commune]